MGDSLRTAWNKATIMRSMVLIGALLACVSSVPFDAGYGVPAAPLIASPPVPVVSHPLLHSIPAPAAPLPLQLLHAGPVLQQPPLAFPHVAPAPLVHSVPQPVLHSAPAPIQVASAAFGFQPALAPAPLGIAPAPLPFAAAPAPFLWPLHLFLSLQLLQASSTHRMSLASLASAMRTLTLPRLRPRMPLASPAAVISMLMLMEFSKL